MCHVAKDLGDLGRLDLFEGGQLTCLEHPSPGCDELVHGGDLGRFRALDQSPGLDEQVVQPLIGGRSSRRNDTARKNSPISVLSSALTSAVGMPPVFMPAAPGRPSAGSTPG
jgi:hypothetical protein